jgi:hypothetical protein
LKTKVGTVRSLWCFQMHVACLNERNPLRQKKDRPDRLPHICGKGSSARPNR